MRPSTCQAVLEAVQVAPIVERVALKILDPDRGRDPRNRARLRREALRGALLDDPALLPTCEFGVAQGIAYLARPWVDGFTLADVLARRPRGASTPWPPARPTWPGPGSTASPSVRPGLPAALGAIVTRAMARDPARRYLSAAALAADRDRFLAGAPAPAEEL